MTYAGTNQQTEPSHPTLALQLPANVTECMAGVSKLQARLRGRLQSPWKNHNYLKFPQNIIPKIFLAAVRAAPPLASFDFDPSHTKKRNHQVIRQFGKESTTAPRNHLHWKGAVCLEGSIDLGQGQMNAFTLHNRTSLLKEWPNCQMVKNAFPIFAICVICSLCY